MACYQVTARPSTSSTKPSCDKAVLQRNSSMQPSDYNIQPHAWKHTVWCNTMHVITTVEHHKQPISHRKPVVVTVGCAPGAQVSPYPRPWHAGSLTLLSLLDHAPPTLTGQGLLERHIRGPAAAPANLTPASTLRQAGHLSTMTKPCHICSEPCRPLSAPYGCTIAARHSTFEGSAVHSHTLSCTDTNSMQNTNSISSNQHCHCLQTLKGCVLLQLHWQ
ncbi:hypothetical protein COO60DRAFT_1540558 [Scenedesmus sp. NREL 46B-D3]|nr:hypothetical protein COO60DRAFT_1540558 [Scenedesmus sp. NREL 46B-D3]